MVYQTAVRASATTGNALWATATGTAPAAIITQNGTGLALDVTNGAVRRLNTFEEARQFLLCLKVLFALAAFLN